MDSQLQLPADRDERREILKGYIESRLLPQHIRTVEQAEVIVGIGKEIGLPPIASLRTIHLINGNPTVSPAMMIALANRRNLIQEMVLEKHDEYAKFTVLRMGRKTPHIEMFSWDDAVDLGLAEKDNYKKQPKTMMAWRAIAAAMRVVFPDVIYGLYTPEEMGAVVTVHPENDLEVASAENEETAKQKAAKTAELVETIKTRLASEFGGDTERMNAYLMMLTEHKDEAGDSKCVTLADLDNLAQTKPKWIDGIIGRLDKENVGVPPQVAK